MLQQYLPFTVLKPSSFLASFRISKVATVLTVYGIETAGSLYAESMNLDNVATVLTVYGIETSKCNFKLNQYQGCNSTYRLRY